MLLERVAPEVFDGPVVRAWAVEFLRDPRHHLALAVDGDTVVGMASAVHYVHPDKPPELWINEVGVAPGHQRRGLARRLIQALMDRGVALGCREAWVLTEAGNTAANGLYASMGGVRPAEGTVMYSFVLDGGGADRPEGPPPDSSPVAT